MLGETPQDGVRGGSGALPRKASYSPQPHSLNTHLETEFSRILPLSVIKIVNEMINNEIYTYKYFKKLLTSFFIEVH
ncbi:hypothetical protein DXT76_11285 [Halobacillus trueperi]|uniref:Uncharacterized protein n=1 Tax=Halobacillus trueperi TaxID=156205 RepID=A0A3D8VPS3_9BACI|nr:hypothetical protein DXT76_11285 [Halobacillus trueperi]